MQEIQHKFLWGVLILFLLIGIADIYIIHTTVIPELINGDRQFVLPQQPIPPTREPLPSAEKPPVKASPSQHGRMKIPVGNADSERASGADRKGVATVADDSVAADTERSSRDTSPNTGADADTGANPGVLPPPEPAAESVTTSPASTTSENGPSPAEDRAKPLPKAKSKSLPGFENLRFGPNKTLLWKYEKQTLREVARLIRRHSNVGVILIGHADGAEKEPMALSQARVEKAKSYLVAQGVPADKIETDAKGARKPVTKSTNEEERKKNRRVRVRMTIKDEM